MTDMAHPDEPTVRPDGPHDTARLPHLSRRVLLQWSGVAAVATGASLAITRPAVAAVPNSLMAGGSGSLKALGRTTMPAVSGTFRISLDYFYPAGTMTGYYVYSSFDTAYRDPRVIQTGDRLTVATSVSSYLLDQALTADAWHRIVLEFVPGYVTVFVDGVRQTKGTLTRFPIAAGTTHTYFGYLGDISSAEYNGTAYYDNLRVVSGGATTFERTFDDGAAINWTQTAVGGSGVFGLANPARNSDIGAVAAATVIVPPEVGVGAPFTVRVAGTDATGRGVYLPADGVALTVDTSRFTVTAEPGGYFTVTANSAGPATISATVTEGGATVSASANLTVLAAGDPARIDVTAPLPTSFVGDRMALDRKLIAYDGRELDPATAQWSFTSGSPAVATVDATGLVTALTAGTTTVTATATVGTRQLTDTVSVPVAVLTTDKTRASYWTTARRATAADNIATLPWAAGARDAAVAAADLYVAKGYPYLWSLVTGQMVPRSYGFTSVEQNGCLNCGTAVHAFGQYPYGADVAAQPWKLICPNCQYRFPTNDFAAYYAGGLDHNGLFDPAKAKRHNDALIAAGGNGNLVNTLYSAKADDWGVDDGAGIVLANGSRFTPVAYYNHWKLWYGGEVAKAIRALTNAYLYTGNPVYASAGVVILDRVADVYPTLNLDRWTYPNGYLNSNGNTSRGKAVGSIWETTLVRDHILAYDAFYPALADGSSAPVSAAALTFLNNASRRMDKTNVKRIRRNIEDGLLRQILPAVKRSEVRGNNGMHQATLTAAAVVMDHLPETNDWMEFNFAPGVATGTVVTGGNMGVTFVNDIDRDGNGTEAAPGYNALWLSQFSGAATYLDGYQLAGMPNYDLYANPKFMRMFDGIHPLTMLGTYTPTIGDSGSTGNRALVVNAASMLTAFRVTGRPEYAQAAHWLNGRSVNGLRLGMFDAQPEQIAADIQAVINQHGAWNPTSAAMTGYGFAALRDGVAGTTPPAFTQRAVDMRVSAATKPTVYYSSNDTVQFEASEVGDSITFDFTVWTPTNGGLVLDIWQAPSTYGIYSVALDGVEIASQVSMSGSGAGTRSLGPVNLSNGTHSLQLTLVEATPGHKCGLRRLTVGDATVPFDLGTARGSTLYFGRNGGHGHKDTLNIDHFAYGMDLLPDQGYPRYANAIDMHRKSLVINTIAHNTVVVDDLGQKNVVVGFPKGFDGGGAVQFVDVDAPQAYTQTTRYRRALAQVRIDANNSYLVDFFRIVGGTRHLYSFHAMQATSTTVAGATLVPQKDGSGAYVGTYAGASTPYNDTVDDPTGFSYFYDVDRATGTFGDLAVTWQGLKDTWGAMSTAVGATTDVNVRLTLLGGHTDVALANCEPPQNKPGNPTSLRYLLARSQVSNGSSIFTGVIEPYRGSRIVQNVQLATVTTLTGGAVAAQDVRAVRVTLPGGRVDTIVHAVDPSQTYLIDGVRFSGAFGVRTTRTGSPDEVHLVEGAEYGSGLTGRLRAVTGTVTGFTQTLGTANTVSLALDAGQSGAVTPADLVGRYLFVTDDGVRNAVYRIEAVNSWTSTSAQLSIGRATPIRGYVNPNDFSQGFTYDLATGRTFRLPLRHTQ